jgi:hypothetical protein
MTLTLWSLTLEFGLLFENFNLGHNFWWVSGRAFIFYICIPFARPWPWPTDILPSFQKTLTLVINTCKTHSFECSALLKFLMRQKKQYQFWNLCRGPFWHKTYLKLRNVSYVLNGWSPLYINYPTFSIAIEVPGIFNKQWFHIYTFICKISLQKHWTELKYTCIPLPRLLVSP